MDANHVPFDHPPPHVAEPVHHRGDAGFPSDAEPGSPSIRPRSRQSRRSCSPPRSTTCPMSPRPSRDGSNTSAERPTRTDEDATPSSHDAPRPKWRLYNRIKLWVFLRFSVLYVRARLWWYPRRRILHNWCVLAAAALISFSAAVPSTCGTLIPRWSVLQSMIWSVQVAATCFTLWHLATVMSHLLWWPRWTLPWAVEVLLLLVSSFPHIQCIVLALLRIIIPITIMSTSGSGETRTLASLSHIWWCSGALSWRWPELQSSLHGATHSPCQRTSDS